MSLDAEIRVYERALLRSGQDPHAVACGLLGVDQKRFLLLIDNNWAPDSAEAKKVHATTVYSAEAGGQAITRNLWALNIVTLLEFLDMAKSLGSRGIDCVVWDELEQVCVRSIHVNWIFSCVVDGWVEDTSPPFTHQLSVSFIGADGRATPPSGDVVSNPLTAVVHPQFRDQEPPYEDDFD